jgi:hypothetical protein
VDAIGRMKEAVRGVTAARVLLQDAKTGMEVTVERAQIAERLLDEALSQLDKAVQLAQHAIDYWTGQMRRRTAPARPSELPDSKLGSQLTRIRDYLCPAPGARPDPMFDEILERMGLEQARGLIAQFGQLPVDEQWTTLRTLADRRK